MMPASQSLRSGFVRRSLDEFKRLSGIIIGQEALSEPLAPFPLIYFHNDNSVHNCKVMCDQDIGGYSTASLVHVPATRAQPGHAIFKGSISTRLPSDKPKIQRTGYAAWRTLDRKATIFGKSLWDIDPYSYIALRVKSDGRKYFVNLMTEAVVPTDIHQHRIFARKPGEWETILIDWNEFVRTNHGLVVQPAGEMLRQKLKSIGIGLTDRAPGPFELAIERIWATNGLQAGDYKEDSRPAGLSGFDKELADIIPQQPK